VAGYLSYGRAGYNSWPVFGGESVRPGLFLIGQGRAGLKRIRLVYFVIST